MNRAGEFFSEFTKGFAFGIMLVLTYELISNGWAEWQGEGDDDQ